MAELSGLSVQQADGVTVLSFGGATLDMAAIRELAAGLYEAVEHAAGGRAVLDFKNIRFLSSQALGVLLTLRRKADAAGVKVALAYVRPELRRVFAVTNLETLFKFHATCEEAIAAFTEE